MLKYFCPILGTHFGNYFEDFFFILRALSLSSELIRPIERSGDVRAREPWEDPRGEAEGKGVVEKGCTERECPIGSISLPTSYLTVLSTLLFVTTT